MVSWLMSAGYSSAALYLTLVYAGVAQTLGVTLFGVIMFQILARDYADPRRLIVNLAPPVFSIALVQGAAAMLRIKGGQLFEVVTLIASPCIVLLVFRAVQKDLTENRRQVVEASLRAEASARQIEDDHRIALMAEELAGLGQWRLDAKGGRFTCSEGVRQIYGIAPSAENPSIEAILAMHDADDRTAVSARVAQAMRDGTPFSFESRITTADGEVRHVLVNAAAELDAAGEVETVFGATMDVTQARARARMRCARASRASACWPTIPLT